ncbi:putative endonuclease [Nitrosospira sp. Nsp11]|uniref:GIY-YIG nuclease family protein n=1 Tax=Nitrosospira sp. Nsp11 TaxID=1855338 RepID=UPI00091BF0A8|nr:putative endonuclease [Nitrosospira sp. Nsp11]
MAGGFNPKPAESLIKLMGKWNVYMVRCSDGSLYTGIALNVAQRVDEHNTNDVLAAKYTRPRRPVMLVYQEQCDTRSAASKREYEIKQMDKKEKLMLIMADPANTCCVTIPV